MINITNTRVPNKQVSFNGFPGGNAAKKFMSEIDFIDSNTPRKAVMILYTGCILARLASSRDKYEFRETLLRDSLGWTSLFFAAAASEKLFAWTADKLTGCKNVAESLFMTTTGKKEFPKLGEVLKPGSKYILRGFDDIKAMKIPGKSKLLANKTFSYLASLGVAIAVLGIIIPKLNTIMTRKEIMNEDNSKVAVNNNQPGSSNVPFQSQSRLPEHKLTMEEFLKSSLNQG